jgi:hypothetical protein
MMKYAILFVVGLGTAMAVPATPVSATPCTQQCYAAYQACLASGTNKTLCRDQKNECLLEC